MREQMAKAAQPARVEGVRGFATSGNMRFRACITFISRRNPHAFVVGGSSDGIPCMHLPKNHLPTGPYGLGLIIEWE